MSDVITKVEEKTVLQGFTVSQQPSSLGGISGELERLVGCAILYKGFRDRLLADPEKALKETNIHLTEGELQKLKGNLERIKLEAAIAQFDKTIATGNLWW